MEKLMTEFKLLLGGVIAATLLTTPVLARGSQPNTRHVAEDAGASVTSDARYIDGRLCTPAPRVGAFATQPWDNDTPCEPSAAY
jgi:hypothetical protein